MCRWDHFLGKMGYVWARTMLLFGVMDEARTSLRLHSTSTGCIKWFSTLIWYAVDGHMGAPWYCNTCAVCRGGPKGYGWALMRLCYVKWLMVKTASDCIPHPYRIQSILAPWLYSKGFSTNMLWMGIWVHLSLKYMCNKWGHNFEKYGTHGWTQMT